MDAMLYTKWLSIMCLGSSIESEEESQWSIEAGAERTIECGQLLSGKALVFFGKNGDRILQTIDLDLTHAT